MTDQKEIEDLINQLPESVLNGLIDLCNFLIDQDNQVATDPEDLQVLDH